MTVRERVFRVFAQVMSLPVDQVTEAASPNNTKKWDSLRHMNLVLALEEEFGVELTDDRLMAMKDMASALHVVEMTLSASQ